MTTIGNICTDCTALSTALLPPNLKREKEYAAGMAISSVTRTVPPDTMKLLAKYRRYFACEKILT